MDWDKIHTIQDLLDPTSSDNSEQYDTKRTEANELPFPPLSPNPPKDGVWEAC